MSRYREALTTSFFDEGQTLPTLARANTGPQLWIHPQDAQKRQIASGTPIVIANKRGHFEAKASVTEDILRGEMKNSDFIS